MPSTLRAGFGGGAGSGVSEVSSGTGLARGLWEWAGAAGAMQNRETVKTVRFAWEWLPTPLKRGVNERDSRCMHGIWGKGKSAITVFTVGRRIAGFFFESINNFR